MYEMVLCTISQIADAFVEPPREAARKGSVSLSLGEIEIESGRD